MVETFLGRYGWGTSSTQCLSELVELMRQGYLRAGDTTM